MSELTLGTEDSVEDRYGTDHIERLVADLIPEDEVRQGRSFGVHIVDGDDEHADIGRFVEAVVFREHFDNDLPTLEREYGPYDRASTFLLVLDYERKRPVGAIRIIRPSEAGLKSINDIVDPSSPWYREGDTAERRFREIGDDPEHTVDISTMAVMPDYRTSHARDGASAALYSTCVRWSLDNNYNRWVTIVDKHIYNMMQSWGRPFQPFEDAEMASYLDSPESIPVHAELHSGLQRIQEFDREMSEKTGQHMDIHGLYTRGSGLEEQFVLPAFADTVQ